MCILVKDDAGLDKLGQYLDGPVTPKPGSRSRSGPSPKRRAPRRSKPSGPKGDGGPPSPRGSVPKVPLVKV